VHTQLAAYANPAEAIRQGLEEAILGKLGPAAEFFEDLEAERGIPGGLPVRILSSDLSGGRQQKQDHSVAFSRTGWLKTTIGSVAGIGWPLLFKQIT
jgi:hypothetical protein